MNERRLIDEIHALANGFLSAEEADRLRERCARDPELQALLDGYVEVLALTETADVEPPLCRVTFEEVEGAFVPQRVRRVVLHRAMRVAAAVLVLVVGGLLLGRALSDRSDRSAGGEAGRPFVLAEIPREEAAAPLTGPVIPESLATYRPVEDKEIRWIADLEEAKALARASSRPVLLFLTHPQCPWCIRMHEETFTHAEVLAELPGFVPALVDVTTASPDVQKLARKGWPFFGVLDPDGAVVLAFPGLRGPGEFSVHLRQACEISGPPTLSWARANELARIWFDANRAEAAGRYNEAYASYSALAEVDRAPLIGQSARLSIARIGQRARSVLLAIRELAESEGGANPALTLLETEISCFDGTPYAGDLERVRDHLKESGRFPEIAALK